MNVKCTVWSQRKSWKQFLNPVGSKWEIRVCDLISSSLCQQKRKQF